MSSHTISPVSANATKSSKSDDAPRNWRCVTVWPLKEKILKGGRPRFVRDVIVFWMLGVTMQISTTLPRKGLG